MNSALFLLLDFWSVKGCSAEQQASRRESWRVGQQDSGRVEEQDTRPGRTPQETHIYCICHAELRENGKLFAKWVYDFHFDSTNWSELRLRSCFRLSCAFAFPRIRLRPRLLLIDNLVPCQASLPAAAAAAAVCLLWFTRAELTICCLCPLFCLTQLQFFFILFFFLLFYFFSLSLLCFVSFCSFA